jgi:AcrR family transcriptional regulator
MPRPSQQLDQALLRSGRVLYPALGGAGLSQRRLAEHAGTSPGMFHYHFESKDAFLRTLLQQLYEEMFARLVAGAAQPGPALARLRHVLGAMARFVREQRPLIVRLALDAAGGLPVAREFVRDNAPRHVTVLMQLLDQAQREGDLPPGTPVLQRVALLMGGVIAPMVLVPAMASLGVALPTPLVEAQVTGDEAIMARIEMALVACRAGTISRTPETA